VTAFIPKKYAPVVIIRGYMNPRAVGGRCDKKKALMVLASIEAWPSVRLVSLSLSFHSFFKYGCKFRMSEETRTHLLAFNKFAV
jgi:hypothetical protein